jgi:hypothetical protein
MGIACQRHPGPAISHFQVREGRALKLCRLMARRATLRHGLLSGSPSKVRAVGV